MKLQYVCLKCNSQFEHHKKDKKYCSHACYASRFQDVDKLCEFCKKQFIVKYRFRAAKFSKDYFYRSSYELAFLQKLELREDIIECISEPMRIEYIKDEQKHNYVPDFLLTLNDGSKQLIEVKPESLAEHPINALKMLAAKQFCVEQDISFKVINENDIFGV